MPLYPVCLYNSQLITALNAPQFFIFIRKGALLLFSLLRYKRSELLLCSSILIMAFLTAPEQSPQNVTAYAYSSTAIQISWYPPPSTSQNGIITSYRITIQGSSFDTDVIVISVSVTTPVYPLVTGDSYLITHLHPYNEYTISVTAVNSVGESGSSDPINTTTLQSCKFICYSDCLQ